MKIPLTFRMFSSIYSTIRRTMFNLRKVIVKQNDGGRTTGYLRCREDWLVVTDWFIEILPRPPRKP